MKHVLLSKGKMTQARWLKPGDWVRFGNCLDAQVVKATSTASIVIVEIAYGGQTHVATLPPLLHIGLGDGPCRR